MVIAIALLALLALQETPTPRAAAPGAVAPALAEPVVPATVLAVIDGDTLEVSLDGAPVTLRLLSVDTEEKISGRAGGSRTKPQTVFGQETMLWARELYAGFPQPVEVGLLFPEGRRADAYGRLLCHVLLPDGRDFNLLLVELGKSPYFNKYGDSRLADAAFRAAQARARAQRLGIWDPATNRARTPGAPSALRPYAELLPWWEARARALAGFAARQAAEPERWLSAEEPAQLWRAFESCQREPEARVNVLATVVRFYEERDGSLTVLLRDGDAETALRASVPSAARAALEPLLRASTAEFRQNYLVASGRMQRHERGFLLRDPVWAVAEPRYPPR